MYVIIFCEVGKSVPVKNLDLRKDELTVLNGCVLWGNRVVIPPQGRESVINELHESHPGIVKMKSLARCYTWRPSIDKDLEMKVSACRKCQENRNFPMSKQSLHPWGFPSKPWSRLHIDYDRPIDGHMFLVVVDAFSEWLEVIQTNGCAARITISKLRNLFITYGLPDIIVSDNATAFVGKEFNDFLSRNGIRHVTGAPYHPATNGLAENAVKTFKQAYKKCDDNVEDSLQKFLFDYRVTPNVTTGIAPCELLMKRRLKTRFDLLKPNIEGHVLSKQENQAKMYRCIKKPSHYDADENVYFKNYSRIGYPNISGTVVECTGPLSCKIQSEEGTLVHRHYDQMFKQVLSATHTSSCNSNDVPRADDNTQLLNGSKGIVNGKVFENPVGNSDIAVNRESIKPSPDVELRRSSRVHKLVERLNL